MTQSIFNNPKNIISSFRAFIPDKFNLFYSQQQTRRHLTVSDQFLQPVYCETSPNLHFSENENNDYPHTKNFGKL